MAYYTNFSSPDFSTHVANPGNETKLNESLLAKLLSIHAPSKEEEPMITFILEHINKTIPNVKINIDANKNIFITKGESAYIRASFLIWMKLLPIQKRVIGQ